MVGDSGESLQAGPWFGRRGLGVLLWLWLGLVGFSALLAGMVADGCSDSECDTKVQIAWLLLMAAQACVIGVGILIRTRLDGWLRLGVLAGLAVVSPMMILAFVAYVDRFF